MKPRIRSVTLGGCEISVEAPDPAELRAAQILTSNALMLALDEGITVDEAAADLARLSRGDEATLDLVVEQIEAIANEHPGPGADRALAIVGGATARVASLRRHPSSDRRPFVMYLVS